MADYARLHGWVTGHVQGVGFRFFAQDIASQYNLYGWVMNLPDSRVEFVVEGTKGLLDDFLKDIIRGPRAGYVSNVDVKWESFTGEFNSFRIKI